VSDPRPSRGPALFEHLRHAPQVDAYLRSINPWWEGKPGRRVPPYRRWAFAPLLRRLELGLAPAVVLRGARQVGKTTLQEQAITHLLHAGVDPRRILRVQFDDLPGLRGSLLPLLALCEWFAERVLGESLNEAAHAGRPAYLFFDEIQNLKDWAPQLKTLVDHHTAHVVATGSSALRIEAGRDSLAGRITTLELGTLLLREIAGLRFGEEPPPLLPPNGLEPLLEAAFWQDLAAHGRRHREARDRAFRAFSAAGGYPFAHDRPDAAWPEVADQLNENVVRKVIRHDLRSGEGGRTRDPALLEEVFRLACRYAGQAPGPAIFVHEIRAVLGSDAAWPRIARYLRFLDGALLLRLVRPLELRKRRARGNPKLCLVDHGLRASWLEEVVPLDPAGLEAAPHLADLAGNLAESAAGAFLAGLPHLDVACFPERREEPEVDFVLSIGDRRIPVEVKYRRRIDPLRDTVGLRSFLERAHYNAPFGVLVTLDDEARVPDPRIVCLPLSSLLLMR
jgi:predicted AAA+ superfamily ATPase